MDIPTPKIQEPKSQHAARLLEWFAPFRDCAVALSGGVDSAVVARAAQQALGEQAWAFTGSSASLAEGELEQAKALAAHIGIRHVVLETREFQNPRYVQNASDRCYHCKTELYDQILHWLDARPVDVIVNGANVDDLGDYRPGMRAAAEHQVRSPLAECGLRKGDVRNLARRWDLPVWDKPASPCLSSRVAYGEEVTPDRLLMIDQAERWLRAQGFAIVRVRYHTGDMARVEVLDEDIDRLCAPELRRGLAQRLQELGFRFVTVDLAGFRSGSLNAFVPLSDLAGPAGPSPSSLG